MNASLSERRFQPLPGVFTVHDFAENARRAMLQFLRGAISGWSREDLDQWLATSYSIATASAANRAEGGEDAVPGLHGAETAVERTVLRARDALMEQLDPCVRSSERAAFARTVVDRGYVVGVLDRVGALGYVPIDCPETTLADRVASLLAADYLTRPSDYEGLAICQECDEISFDAAAAHAADCALSTRHSRVVPKNATPAPGLPTRDAECA